MKGAPTVTFFVCLVYETLAQGNIDAIVNDAVQSALFGGRPAPGVAGFGSAGFIGAGRALDIERIPAGTFLDFSRHFSIQIGKVKANIMSFKLFFSEEFH